MKKVYRSAKGRVIDWTAMAGASVPTEQRELQRASAPAPKPAQRIIGGFTPAEHVEEEIVEDAKPARGKRKPAEPEDVTEPEPTE